MGLSKKQVEMHIAGVERRLGGSQEVRSVEVEPSYHRAGGEVDRWTIDT